jgi:hypothetical protein
MAEMKGQTKRKLAIWSTAGIAVAIGVVVMFGGPRSDGQDGTGRNSAAGAALRAQLEGLDASGASVAASGRVSGTDESTPGQTGRYAGSAADVFRPARGRASRQGSNAEGPYELRLYTDAVHADDPDKTVRARVTLVLPPRAAPGEYTITAWSDPSDDAAYASFRGDDGAWRFSRNVEGSLVIDRLDDAISAAWRFEARNRDGDAVQITGAVRDLAFAPQAETRLALTRRFNTVEHFGRLAINRDSAGRRVLSLGREVYLELPPDVSAGAYPVTTRRTADDDITMRFLDHHVEALAGRITLENDGPLVTGAFDLSASGAQDISLSGEFSYPVTD